MNLRKVLKALCWVLVVYGIVCVVVSIFGTVSLLAPNSTMSLAAEGTTVYRALLAAVALEIGGLVTIVLAMLGLANNIVQTKTSLYRFVLVLMALVDVAAFIACIVGRAHIVWTLILALAAMGTCALCFKIVADEKAAARAKKEAEAARKAADMARREQAAANAAAQAAKTPQVTGAQPVGAGAQPASAGAPASGTPASTPGAGAPKAGA